MEKQGSVMGRRLSLLDAISSLSLQLRRNHVTDYLRSGRTSRFCYSVEQLWKVPRSVGHAALY